MRRLSRSASVKARADVGEAGEAEVGLVGAVLAHGFVIGDAREWLGEVDAGGAEACGEEVFNDGED